MTYSRSEIMIVTAARALTDRDVCFVGIGLPSAACNLARLTRAPGITLIYESGTIGARPDVLPLSIGDGELCRSALTTVSVPEMFRYWLQGGRITVGFLSAAEIDKHGNINTTVIGDYDKPKVRLPGGGGAPEIMTSCGEVFVVLNQSRRSFVDKVSFTTSFGYGAGGDHRQRLGITTKGPTRIITDLAVMAPEAETNELIVVSLHPGVSRDDVLNATGWNIRFAERVEETPAPNDTELEILRDLNQRTAIAHGDNA